MKKMLLSLLISLLVSTSIFCQADALADIKLATMIVDYAQENESATALLEAADILIQTEGKLININDSKEIADDSAYIRNLILKARKISPRDRLVKIWSKQILSYLDKEKNTRGSKNIVKYDCNSISNNSEVCYRDIAFSENALAEVFVHSKNNADISVEILSDIKNEDFKVERIINGIQISWIPRKTNLYTIRLVNNSKREAIYEVFIN